MEIIIIFIGVLLLIACLKYKEGLENASDPQTESNEQQGSIQNLHGDIEELKKTINKKNIDDLMDKITELNDLTYKLQKNIPDGEVSKYRST